MRQHLLGMAAIAATLPAAAMGLEAGPFTLVKVTDGDTIVVSADAGKDPLKVRLLYVDAPEIIDNDHGPEMAEGHAAKAMVEEALPAGTSLKLWSPGDKPALDAAGRTLAIVECQIADPETREKKDTTLQEALILRGYSVYWRKNGDADEPWNKRFADAQDAALKRQQGAWSTSPKWMLDKASERPDGQKAADPPKPAAPAAPPPLDAESLEVVRRVRDLRSTGYCPPQWAATPTTMNSSQMAQKYFPVLLKPTTPEMTKRKRDVYAMWNYLQQARVKYEEKHHGYDAVIKEAGR